MYWSALREYVLLVARTWWLRIGLLSGLLGLGAQLFSFDIPPWIWQAAVGVCVVLAQYQAYYEIRRERDRACKEAEPHASSFVPALLQNRLLQNLNESVPSLIVRAAIAASVPTGVDIDLGTNEKQLFKSAIEKSQLEHFIREWTTLGEGKAGSAWQRIGPTTSFIATLVRAPERGFSNGLAIEARAVLDAYFGRRPQAQRQLITQIDVICQPAKVGRGTAPPLSHPLSLQDFFDLVWVMVDVVAYELAPRVFEHLVGSRELLSCSASMRTTGQQRLGDYVGLSSYRWVRAEGSSDTNGGNWDPVSEVNVLDPAMREASLKAWVNKMLSDSSYENHEPDVERLEPPPRAPQFK